MQRAALCCLLSLSVAAPTSAADEDGDGTWRTISVYVGSKAAAQAKHGDPQKPANMMDDDRPKHFHSQGYQDGIIASLFKKKRGGYFVDLAANHPLFISNTRALERDLGWHGLCIDANDQLVGDLARRRTCTVVDAVLSARAGESLSFRSVLTTGWETGLSGLVDGTASSLAGDRHAGLFARLWRALTNAPTALPTQDVARVTTTLAEVLSRHGAPRTIDYLSLDVEGAEMAVMGAFPFDVYTFRAMTLERPSAPLKALLARHGYSYVRHLDMVPGSDLDELWVHASMRHAVSPALLRKSCPRRLCLRGQPNATRRGP